MKTAALYDGDAYLSRFEARVLSCTEGEDGRYRVILDRTAFFPEQGGQSADRGTLSGTVRVLDAHIWDGVITHLTDGPLDVGQTVGGEVDFARRFGFMQQHTGEHIMSGLAHRMYGCTNVGFHLSDRQVTMDYDRDLTSGQVSELELRANEAVYKNLPVRCWYPTKEEAAALDYRSKKEITEGLRIVSIGDVDDCACCAPHVRFTGEIGLIKVMSAMRYKGGTRLSILCGQRALMAFSEKQAILMQLGRMMSCGEDELAHVIAGHEEEARRLRARAAQLETGALVREAREAAERGEAYLLTDVRDERALIAAAEALCGQSETGCVFSGTDEEGYRLIVMSKTGEARERFRLLQSALDARGGGDGTLIRGKTTADRARICRYFGAERPDGEP